MTTSSEPPIDSGLIVPLRDTVSAQELGWMEAHKINTQVHAECRVAYEALVEAVR